MGLIVHYNLPQNIENYIHRSGRTARIYKKGTCISFIGPGDTKSLIGIEKLLGKKIEKYKVDKQKLGKSEEIVKIAGEIAENESFYTGNSKDYSWKQRATEALGLENSESKPKIAKKHIKTLKKRLEKAKNSIELPRKRCSVITPELYQLAKHQKII